MVRKIVQLFVFTSVLCQVYSLQSCNSDISDYILKNNAYPEDTLSTLTQGAWNYVVFPSADIAEGADCIRQYFDGPSDTCKSARTITYYKLKDQTVEDCEVADLGGGAVFETKSKGRTYNLYFFQISASVWGFYRCGDADSTGVDQGACLVSCGTDVTDATVADEIKQCRAFLEAAGVNCDLTSVNVCESLIG